jgi:hypothetical protein
MGLTRRYKEAVQRLYSRPSPYLRSIFLKIVPEFSPHLATSALVCLLSAWDGARA